MHVGLIVEMHQDTDVAAAFNEALRMGIRSCQLVCWDRAAMTDAMARQVREARIRTDMEISAFWCGWNGPKVWDFYEGPATLGLVPSAYRFQRLQILLEGCSFAKAIGVRDIVTHVGFLPENPSSTEYAEILCALKTIVASCKEKQLRFLFETGQETPVTLKRTIQDLGGEYVGVNLDPANLIMYGKANPIDALEVFGEYVMGVHGKDGCYPTDGHDLGKEVPLGQGKVDYPRLIAKLREVGYDGPITIEREISGPEQIEDIVAAKKLLDSLL